MADIPNRNVLTVTQLNKYIKQILSNDIILSSLWVRGEISNYKNHSSGHMYFTMKDDGAIIKCVMFKGHNNNLKFKPQDGMRVIIKGNVSTYEKDGIYQLYADYMEPDGRGSLNMAFEQLKAELFEKGYFDESRKKKIPLIPNKICVVTSPTGAVVRDIIKILNRRYPNFNLSIYPVAVQGDLAVPQISKAIATINKKELADVIILARGGGSLEELWAFNEREVANAIFDSKIPIISAIGHETDYTIADFVADLRAPTPSVAAELVLPEKAGLQNIIYFQRTRLYTALNNFTILKRTRLAQLLQRPVLARPTNFLDIHRYRVESIQKFISTYLHKNLMESKSIFGQLAGKLEALSPLNILHRGYGVIRNFDTEQIINTIQNVNVNDKINLELYDGKICCMVKSVYAKEGKNK